LAFSTIVNVFAVRIRYLKHSSKRPYKNDDTIIDMILTAVKPTIPHEAPPKADLLKIVYT